MKPFLLAAALALLSASAAAQETPGNAIIVTTQDIPAQYEDLGDVHAEILPTSMLPKVPVRQSLNEALRAEAAKRGANAVIKVVYGKRSFLDKYPLGADGKAVRITMAPPAPVSASISPPSAPSPIATSSSSVARKSEPLASTPSAVAAINAPSAPAAIAGPVSPPVQHASSADKIIITQDDIPYRRYTVLGDVSATALRTALFMKVEPEEMMDEQMRKQAFGMGADAVILVKYTMGARYPSTPSTAAGKAVRFD